MGALNQAYVPFSSSPTAPGLNSGTGFEELLKRTQNASGAVSTPTKPAITPIDKNDKLFQMCVELETFLIKNLIKGMRGTVQKTKLIDTGLAGEMYEDMLYDEYAKTFSQNANLGFAEMAYRDLTRYLL